MAIKATMDARESGEDTFNAAATKLAPSERLDAARFSDPGFAWRIHEALVPSNTPRAHLTNGDFWRQTVRHLRRGDRIIWATDDLTRFGELVLVAFDLATARCELRELSYIEVEPATVRESEKVGFSPRDLGLHGGWSIVRDSDGCEMAKNIPSYDEAMRRIRTEYIPEAPRQVVMSRA